MTGVQTCALPIFGLEMGTVYAALGSHVTVVEATGGLLPGADRDLVDILAKRLGTTFESIMLNTKVTEIVEKSEQSKWFTKKAG